MFLKCTDGPKVNSIQSDTELIAIGTDIDPKK